MQSRAISKEAVYAVLRHYVGQYRKYPIATAFAFVLPALGTILVFFVPPLILARLIDLFSQRGFISLESTGVLIALFAGAWLLGEAMWRVGTHFLVLLKSKSHKDLHITALNFLNGRSLPFFANNFVGSLTSRSYAFIFGFEGFTDILHYNFFTNIFTITFAMIVLGTYSLILPLLLLACIVLLIVVAVPRIKYRSKLVAIRHEAGSKISGRFSDIITNMAAVKAFAAEPMESKMFLAQVDDFVGKYKRAANYHNLRIDTRISPLYVATNTIGLIASIFLASRLGLQPSVVIVVFSYFVQVTGIFWQINYTYRTVESTIGGAAEFTQLFLTPEEIIDAPNAGTLSVTSGAIDFKKVSFDYQKDKEGSETFLKQFNLHIPAGQKVGLVGPSGGGKTTITKLLLRFVDANKGTITIDGTDITTVTQHSLRSAIAYVPQDPLLFHRSLFENIAYGTEGASREDIVTAAKLARAHDFIEALPEKYDTLVGERGIKLSGGQRQRIAIARALLKNAKILVLDEATSALDSESEKYIQEGLWELMKEKTALVIAHRLSTIKHLDRILVLDNGKIVQDGSHEELLKEIGGIYAKLWNHQSGGFMED